MIRTISANQIKKVITVLSLKACRTLPPSVEQALITACSEETHKLGQFMLKQIVENVEVAKQMNWPICQDTGMTVVFLEIGQDVHITGGSLTEAINQGVADAYQEGFFRKSVVAHPLERINTGDNTPAVIHTEIVPGQNIKIIVAPKGFGSENMSRSFMLKPTTGTEGVIHSIVRTVKEAGGNPCPPLIVGVGLGGTFEKAALLAKKALIKPVGEYSKDELLADIEAQSLARINSLGIGPQGVGGDKTALAVHIEAFPTHIAGLPVVVNLQCHAARHASFVI